MIKSIRGIRAIPMLLLVGVALTWTLWQGCDNPQGNPTNPAGTQQSVQNMPFSKENPVVSHAMDIQTKHTPQLMGNPDVVGTGVGADENGAPVVLILTKREGVENLPASIEGLNTRIQVVGEIKALTGFTGQYDPVPGGVSVGNDLECAAGTIGCLVKKSNGTRYMLSCNHVFARENRASIGERIDQPGRYDAIPQCSQTRQAGNLSAFNTINFRRRSTNVFDAAIAAFSNGISFTGSMVNNIYTPSSTVQSPSVGLAVQKVGRTTGLTAGTISGINVTISVRYSSGTATFVQQIMVSSGNFIQAGDSGSLMVTQSGNNQVGLDFAGGSSASFANPIGPALNYFGVTVTPN